MKNGVRKTVAGRELATPRQRDGRVAFTYAANGKTRNARVSVMVAETFLGPRPEGADVCHNDGDPTNNRVENLRYDTHSENMRDMVRHGRNNASKTHCPQGHPYSGDNLRIIPKTGGRVCRTCQKRYAREQRERAKAKRHVSRPAV